MYDASKSRFSFLEIPSVATFVMPGTGKTIDIQELFLITVQQMGGSAKVRYINPAVSLTRARPDLD
jgi:hypothetical protein